MNITKRKQTYRYREQTSGYQQGEGSGEGQYRARELEVQTTVYKINELQGYIITQGIQPIFYNNYKWSITLKIMNHCIVHL